MSASRFASLLVPSLLLLIAAAQTQTEAPHGVIHGTVIGQDGRPAGGIWLAAQRRDVPTGSIVPHVEADDAGNYRFERLPPGKYLVLADDQKRGYSWYSTAPHGPASEKNEVTLSRGNPQAELNFQLPPQSGFLSVKLIDANTGAVIPTMDLTIKNADEDRTLVVSIGSSSDEVVNIPPNRDLLLHVTANGYREWQESIGVGKPIHLAPGERMQMQVRLQPAE